MAHAQRHGKGGQIKENSGGRKDFATLLHMMTGEVSSNTSCQKETEKTTEKCLVEKFSKEKSGNAHVEKYVKEKLDTFTAQILSEEGPGNTISQKDGEGKTEMHPLENLSEGGPSTVLIQKNAKEEVGSPCSQQTSVKDFISSGVEDPFVILPREIIMEVLSYLSPEELVLFRACSKSWQTALDFYATNPALLQHFETMGVVPQWHETREEANLRFRRGVFYHQSLKAGRAVNMSRITDTDHWHINGNYIVVASMDGHVALLESAAGGHLEMKWKLQCVVDSSIKYSVPHGTVGPTTKIVLEDVTVTASGCVLIDTRPTGIHCCFGSVHVWSTLYSKTGDKMWIQELGIFSGHAYVDNDKIFRVECEKTQDPHIRGRYATWFVVRSVHSGHVVCKKQLPISSTLNLPFSPPLWSLTLYGFMDCGLLFPVSRPALDVLVINLHNGQVEGRYTYEKREWQLAVPKQYDPALAIQIMVDQASPKSSAFQPSWFDVEARLRVAYVAPQASLPHPMKTSQRLMWFDLKKDYIKDIFFQLDKGIIKVRSNDGCEVSSRRIEESLHWTQSRPYRCLTVPDGEGSRTVVVVKAFEEHGLFSYLGMAGKFLAVHNTSDSELSIFDFRAPW